MINTLMKEIFLSMNIAFKACMLLLLTIFIWSCKTDGPKVEIPDVSNIDIPDFKFVRFDKAVNDLDTNKIKSDFQDLKSKYPSITTLYFNRLLDLKSEDEDTFYNKIKAILSAEEIKAVNDTVNYTFPNTDKIERELQQACRLLKYYLPGAQIPHFYTVQTEFGYQNFIFDDENHNGIGIGLDMFLGGDFDYKYLDPANPSFSEYLTRSYNKDHIVKKSMELAVLDLIGDPNGKRFIDFIIHNGKKLYILKKILPTTHDSIIFEFSKKQMEWINENELEMWSFFLDRELIYETNHLKINKYISSSPNSPGMPKGAPGRTGNYIGLQIVNAYMKRNPEVSIEALIANNDAQKLMELSKYKPKRR